MATPSRNVSTVTPTPKRTTKPAPVRKAWFGEANPIAYWGIVNDIAEWMQSKGIPLPEFEVPVKAVEQVHPTQRIAKRK